MPELIKICGDFVFAFGINFVCSNTYIDSDKLNM